MSDDNNGSGGRTLGGGDPEPLPAGWGSSSAPRVGRIGQTSSRITPNSSGRIASLRDLASSGPAPAPPAHDHSDGDDSGDDGAGGENWYTGGERSGLNVQNPERPSTGNNTVRDILRKAAQAPRAPEESGPSSRRSAFSGSGHVLGSDDVESQFVPDPNAPTPSSEEQETVIRHLTFWRDGFSIEDGPLMRYDNPENQRVLDAINSGNAPPSVLGVQVNQPVELRVARRVEEAYEAPPKKLEAFVGTGNRLGGVAPTVADTPNTSTMPGAFLSSSSSATASSTFDEAQVQSINARFEVDMSQPNTSIQIRLADGTRLVCRMNLTHTVGDIRNFINASRPAAEQRPYTIGTTFPNKTLDDDTITVENGGLKNSVIVQRWV